MTEGSSPNDGLEPAAPAPETPPSSAAPAPAAEPAKAVPVMPSTPRPSLPRRFLEWFWRGRAIAELRRDSVALPQRARDLYRRGLVAAEIGDRALEPSGPLRHGPGDGVACSLYRDAIYWLLAAAAVARGEPIAPRDADLRPLWNATDRALLLAAAADSEALSNLEAQLFGTSFIDFAERAPDEQRRLAWACKHFVKGLIAALDTVQARVDRLRLQRVLRVGLVVLLFFVAAPIAFLTREWSERRRDLAAGKAWKASSLVLTVCPSPAQYCEETPGYFFHTNEEDNPWLMIDLGSKREFREVKIANRKDCCPERAVPLVVEVGNDKKAWREVAWRKEAFSSWAASFPPTKARYVRVRAPRKTTLHLAEVRVLR